MSDKMKIVVRGARSPRKYKPAKSVAVCDNDGLVVATISFSVYGVHVDHLGGFPVQVNQMNGLGQYQLEDEPEASFNCPHCKDEDYPETPKLYGSSSRKWADGSVSAETRGKPLYRVVCKRCGGGLVE